jgi:SAM-dependent methyltransferase
VRSARPPAYGRIARLYAVGLTALGFRRGIERFLDRLNLDLPPGARVLDAGCGTGLLAFWLLDRLPGVRVVAFDIDRAMVEVAAYTAAARNYQGANLELAIGDLRDPERLIRPGGRLLILGVRQGGMGTLLGHLFRFRPYSLSQLHAAVSACGLVEIRTVPLRSHEFPANHSRVAILARRL